MSTVPGDDTWRDAGLVEHDEDAVSLADESEDDRPAVDDSEHESDEYRPRTPRPDLDGEADEADVVEQASAVPGGDEDYA